MLQNKSQATDSISQFFNIKLGVKGVMSKTVQNKELSTSILCNTGGGILIWQVPHHLSNKAKTLHQRTMEAN